MRTERIPGQPFTVPELNTFGPGWADNLDPKQYAGDFTNALLVAKVLEPQTEAQVWADHLFAAAGNAPTPCGCHHHPLHRGLDLALQEL